MGVWQGCKIFVKSSVELNYTRHTAAGSFVHIADDIFYLRNMFIKNRISSIT